MWLNYNQIKLVNRVHKWDRFVSTIEFQFIIDLLPLDVDCYVDSFFNVHSELMSFHDESSSWPIINQNNYVDFIVNDST